MFQVLGTLSLQKQVNYLKKSNLTFSTYVCYSDISSHQRCKRADLFRPEPDPNPKTNLKPKSYSKKTER